MGLFRGDYGVDSNSGLVKYLREVWLEKLVPYPTEVSVTLHDRPDLIDSYELLIAVEYSKHGHQFLKRVTIDESRAASTTPRHIFYYRGVQDVLEKTQAEIQEWALQLALEKQMLLDWRDGIDWRPEESIAEDYHNVQ